MDPLIDYARSLEQLTRLEQGTVGWLAISSLTGVDAAGPTARAEPSRLRKQRADSWLRAYNRRSRQGTGAVRIARAAAGPWRSAVSGTGAESALAHDWNSVTGLTEGAGAGEPRGLRPAVARSIAERAHGVQLDAGQQPMMEHIRRVAMATPRQARCVAWLHEVLESGDITEQQLLSEGLTEEELRALRLLSRAPGDRSEASYLGQIARIARSGGTAGKLARLVKRIDLKDRMEHPARRLDGWSPPYERGLAILASAGPRLVAAG